MRILFVGSWYPYPPDNGSRLRYYNLIKQLSAHHNVSLISFHQNTEPMTEARLEAMHPFCELVEAVPRNAYRAQHNLQAFFSYTRGQPPALVSAWNANLVERVEKVMHRETFDLVILAHVLNLLLLDSISFDAPVIVEEFQATRAFEHPQGASRLKRLRHRVSKQVWIQFLRKRFLQLAGLTVPSVGEQVIARSLLSSISHSIPIEVVANGVDLSYNRPGLGTPEPNTLIYPGSLEFEANYDAVKYFMHEMMPRIVEAYPAARLRVTGRSRGVNVESLAPTGHIELTGYVDDVRPVVASAAVAVIPLRRGAGTRLKILEAMALGTPVVTTSKGIEGIDATHGEHALIADEPAKFAGHVLSLLANPNLCARLARSARRFVEERYSWEDIGARLCSFCERVVQSDG